MKKIKAFSILLLLMVALGIQSCKKDKEENKTEINSVETLMDALIVKNSEKIKGNIPVPEGVTAEWSVDPEIEIYDDGEFSILSCSSDTANITGLFIQIDGADSYFHIPFDYDGSNIFKTSAIRTASVGVQPNRFVPLNTGSYAAPARVVGYIGPPNLAASYPIPTRWLKPIPIKMIVKKKPTGTNNPGVCANTTLAANVQVNGNTATATASGGKPPYTFMWSNGATTESITNLADGNYTITITDFNRCSKIASGFVGSIGGDFIKWGSNAPVNLIGTACELTTDSGKDYYIFKVFQQTTDGGIPTVTIVFLGQPSPGTYNVTIDAESLSSTQVHIWGSNPDDYYDWESMTTGTVTVTSDGGNLRATFNGVPMKRSNGTTTTISGSVKCS